MFLLELIIYGSAGTVILSAVFLVSTFLIQVQVKEEKPIPVPKSSSAAPYRLAAPAISKTWVCEDHCWLGAHFGPHCDPELCDTRPSEEVSAKSTPDPVVLVRVDIAGIGLTMTRQ